MMENGSNGGSKMVSAMSVESLDNCSTISSDQPSQVRTLFVSGLPMDTRPRELYLLFRTCTGYETSLLKITTKNGKTSTPVGFVTFATRQDADDARRKLQGVRFDPENMQTIRLELARSNTKVVKPKQSSPPIIAATSLPNVAVQQLAAIAASGNGAAAAAAAVNAPYMAAAYAAAAQQMAAMHDQQQQQQLTALMENNTTLFNSSQDPQQQLLGLSFSPFTQAALQQLFSMPATSCTAQLQSAASCAVQQQQQQQAIATAMAQIQQQQQHAAATAAVLNAQQVAAAAAANGFMPPPQLPSPVSANNARGVANLSGLLNTVAANNNNNNLLNQPCTTLFVANLGQNVNEEEIRQLFKSFTGFCRLRIHSKGGAPVAFVEYSDVGQANYVLNTLQGFLFSSSERGQGIRIEFAKTKMGDVPHNNNNTISNGGQMLPPPIHRQSPAVAVQNGK